MKVQTTAALAGLLFAAPAAAADLFGDASPLTIPAVDAPTTVEIGSNWYLRGDVGVSFENGPTLSTAATSIPPLTGAEAALMAGSASAGVHFDGGLGFGYRFNDILRFDATWDARNGAGLSGTTLAVCPQALRGVASAATGAPAGYLYDMASTCAGATHLTERTNTVLANAYADLGDWDGITPYVGAGVGVSVLSINGGVTYAKTMSGQPYAADLTPTGGFPLVWVDAHGTPIAPQPAIPFAWQTWNHAVRSTTVAFAWSLTTGFSYRLTPSVLIDVGYRLLDSGAPRVTINAPTGTTLRPSALSQQVRVGVRYLIQ
jgi:opacity protein-like surface antigen